MADMNFDEVLRELNISADELKRMVADGEIRSFHVGGQLKFKRDDVTKLKNRLETAPTIVLSETDANSILEEPTLEEPSLLDAEESLASEDTVLSVDGLLEDDSPLPQPPAKDESDLIVESDVLAGSGSSVGEDTVLDSGLLEEGDAGEMSLGLDDTQEEGLLEEEGRAAPRRVRARPQEAHPIMTAVAVGAAAVLVIPGAILINLAGGDNGVFPEWIKGIPSAINGVVDGIINLF
jgi:excisionase family DNA binding protein